MKEKYQIIYADPPWQFSSRLINGSGNKSHNIGTRRNEDKYPSLSNKEIMSLPIASISEQECVLFIWTTNAHLENYINVINAWGFKYKTVAFIWNKKEKSGKQVKQRGFYTTSGSELCLLSTKGIAYHLIQSRKENQIVDSPRTEHSTKPDEVRKRIERMYGDLPRIELFARQKTKGWDTWGNEIESDVEL